MMNTWKSRSLAAALAAFMLVTGCAGPKSEDPNAGRYVTPQVQGSNARINLEEVQKAFAGSKGNDFNAWMAAFEKRVNEIYDGSEIVSIDANRVTDRLVVTGYVDKNNQPGFQDGEDKLFTIEQTGPAANNAVPIRVANGDGATYYQGNQSILNNPFLQTFLIMGLMNSWGGRYHTPPSHYGTLRNYRTSYRNTPNFKVQQAENKRFATRFKQKSASDQLESRRRFGTGASSSDNKRRSWNGAPTEDATQDRQRRTWGGRRPSSGFGSGSSSSSGSRRSSGFGGRRRR